MVITRGRLTKSNRYLIWLEWPEKCFRVDAEALRTLATLVPKGSTIVRARSERAFLKELPKATHAVVWNFKAEWFQLAPKLKLLATPAAGRELVPEQGPEGVRIHFGHFHGPIIAETVAAFMLSWSRGFFALAARQRSEEADARWPRTWLSDKMRELAGTNAVIVGYGNIGKAIGAKLEALGVSVKGITRSVSVGNDDLKRADWVILALPSTTGTDGYVNAAFLRKLSKKAVLINIGRGNAIDEGALVAALKSHRLAGAYLDVRRNEPSGTVPFFGVNENALETLGNCVISPHSSAFSPKYVKSCFEELYADGCL